MLAYTPAPFIVFPGVLTTAVFGGEIATALENTSKINYWLVGGASALFVVTTYFGRRWFVYRQTS